MKSKLKSFMVEMAEGAGAILLKYLNKTHRIEHKLNAGIVTEADKFAEDYILKKIFRKYPKSSIITEESGEFKKDPSQLWVIDPLDGTTNYAHGFPWFCTSIGYYEEGVARAGIIYQPVSGEIFYAEKGKGAELNGKKIKVSKTKQISDALVGTGFYYTRGERLLEEMKIFSDFNQVARGVRRPGSAALDLAYVASGRYDGFWERGLSSWDVAAGFLLVTEAGGKISNYGGKDTDIFEKEAVATNGKLHGAMIEIFKKSLG
jgi:myo-inositol-1(or 4)-monophosphatase